mmetsp:Transcript_71742/g.145580  ORF Transcript_71742/g.145580 Transcript_71742/m.145580 type:complete len:523 (+) Transcript_71742:1007-2575(+)
MAGPHHPADGDPPRPGDAPVRPPRVREDPDRPADRKGPERPRPEDRQRTGDPQQVRRRVGGKNPRALCRGGAGTAGDGRQLDAAHRHHGRDGRDLQAAGDRQGRDGRLRLGRQPAAVEDRRRRLPQQHTADRDDEPEGHDRRRPAAAGAARGPRRDRFARHQGTPADPQHPHQEHESRQADHPGSREAAPGAGGKGQEFFRCRAGGTGQGGQLLCAGPLPRRQGPGQGPRHQEPGPQVRRFRAGTERRRAEVRCQERRAEGPLPQRIRPVRGFLRDDDVDPRAFGGTGPEVRQDPADERPAAGTGPVGENGDRREARRRFGVSLCENDLRRRDDRLLRRQQVPDDPQGLYGFLQVPLVDHLPGRHRAAHRLRPDRAALFQRRLADAAGTAQEGPPRRGTAADGRRDDLQPPLFAGPGPRPGLWGVPDGPAAGGTEGRLRGPEGGGAHEQGGFPEDRQGDPQQADRHQAAAAGGGNGQAGRDGPERHDDALRRRQHLYGVPPHGGLLRRGKERKGNEPKQTEP